jgi:hypothetical protein
MRPTAFQHWPRKTLHGRREIARAAPPISVKASPDYAASASRLASPEPASSPPSPLPNTGTPKFNLGRSSQKMQHRTELRALPPAYGLVRRGA